MIINKAYVSTIQNGVDLSKFESDLKDHIFKPCEKSSAFSSGWVPVIRNSDCYLLQSHGCGLFRFCIETRKVDSSVLSEELAVKISNIELQEGRTVGRKEKREIREDLETSLLPSMHSKKAYIYCFVDTISSLLVLGTTNASQIEKIIFYLVETFGDSLGIRPLAPQASPSKILTDWILNNEAPASLEILNQCDVAESSEDKASVSFKNIEPFSSEVTTFLNQGFQVKSVAVSWADRLSIKLSDDLMFRNITYGDSLKETAFHDSEGGEMADLDAMFAITSLTLREFLSSYFKWFDIATPQYDQEA
ncbi:recombination-associated protein RdgC [Marinomonas sp. TI.3.20]|uniref:recombination-associated protein RdgC n=1 Tax=Marinomonas sp. TI.3.20 TaxID=3121296 RepID=UPI00311D7E8F